MAEFEIHGDIVPDSLSWIYDWYGLQCCSPDMVRGAISSLPDGEALTVRINSPGGDVQAGQEIYSLLSAIRPRVSVQIESIACSAASFIAMAGGHIAMSPTALLMIHRSWVSAQGNTHNMLHTAETLSTVDRAIAQAYELRTGMSEDEILALMDKETWFTAADALEKRFIDEIIDYDTYTDNLTIAASAGGLHISQDMIQKAKTARAQQEAEAQKKAEAAAILEDLDLYGL